MTELSNRANRRTQKRLALAEFREQAVEAQSQLSSLILECDGGKEFEIPHPLLVDDETQARFEAFQAGDGLDRDDDGNLVIPHKINGVLAEPIVIRSAKAILGPEKHAEFIAAGGHSNDVTLAWNMLAEQVKEQEADDPK